MGQAGGTPPVLGLYTVFLGPEIYIFQVQITFYKLYFTVLRNVKIKSSSFYPLCLYKIHPPAFVRSRTGFLHLQCPDVLWLHSFSVTILPLGQLFIWVPPPGNEVGFPLVDLFAFSEWAGCFWTGVRTATPSHCRVKTFHQYSHHLQLAITELIFLQNYCGQFTYFPCFSKFLAFRIFLPCCYLRFFDTIFSFQSLHPAFSILI